MIEPQRSRTKTNEGQNKVQTLLQKLHLRAKNWWLFKTFSVGISVYCDHGLFVGGSVSFFVFISVTSI